MRIRQLSADDSPQNKDYWLPVEIAEPQLAAERDTKRIPATAFLFAGELRILQMSADNSPRGKEYWLPVEISGGGETKRIPLSALLPSGANLPLTADNGDAVVLKTIYAGEYNGRKTYRLEIEPAS